MFEIGGVNHGNVKLTWSTPLKLFTLFADETVIGVLMELNQGLHAEAVQRGNILVKLLQRLFTFDKFNRHLIAIGHDIGFDFSADGRLFLGKGQVGGRSVAREGLTDLIGRKVTGVCQQFGHIAHMNS